MYFWFNLELGLVLFPLYLSQSILLIKSFSPDGEGCEVCQLDLRRRQVYRGEDAVPAGERPQCLHVPRGASHPGEGFPLAEGGFINEVSC